MPCVDSLQKYSKVHEDHENLAYVKGSGFFGTDLLLKILLKTYNLSHLYNSNIRRYQTSLGRVFRKPK